MSSLIQWKILGATGVVVELAVVGAFAACATSSEEFEPVVDSGTDATSLAPDAPDAPAPELDAGSEADADAAGTCTKENWCHTVLPMGGLPTGSKLQLAGVWGDGTGVVWAVGYHAKQPGVGGSGVVADLLRWNGDAWSIAFFIDDQEVRFRAIWGSGPTDIWLGATDGLYHGQGVSSDAMTWTHVLAAMDVRSIWGSGPNDVWALALGDDGAPQLLHYTGFDADAAAAWKIDPISPRVSADGKVWGSGPADVWTIGQADGLAQLPLRRAPSLDGGGEWTDVAPAAPGTRVSSGVSFPEDETWVFGSSVDGYWYYARGAEGDGGLFAWDELGNFQKTNGLEVGLSLDSAWGTSPRDLWIAGEFGRLRHWDGTKFRTAAISVTGVPVLKSFRAIWGSVSTPSEIWVVGDDIAIRRLATTGNP